MSALRVMRKTLLTVVLLFLSLPAWSRGQPAAGTGGFAEPPDLSALRTIALQNMQTVKTLDSFSRQFLEVVSGRSSYNGQDPVFTVLDIAYNPESYESANLVKIKNLPLRTEFRRIPSISTEEQERIVKTGMVSLALLHQPEVQNLLSGLQSSDIRKAEAIGQLVQASDTLAAMCTSIKAGQDFFLPVAIIPPATAGDTVWHRLIEMAGNDPDLIEKVFKNAGAAAPKPLPNYDAKVVSPCIAAALDLYTAWKQHDSAAVNTASVQLSDQLAQVNPAAYPSPLLRNVEVLYNRLAKMTLPGAAFYFFAFVCFLMSTITGVASLRLWGLRLLVIGFLVHTAGIGVRWWLVGSIPIKNEFESVMFSAWFGVLVGLLLELGVFGKPGRSIFGAAASFVGWLSLIAIFTVPYVLHTSIGENVGQVNGVLMSYWLYIHVTMVTASYSMIGMSFALSVWWLVKYYTDHGNHLGRTTLKTTSRGFEPVMTGSGSAIATMGPAATLARLLFFPVAARLDVASVKSKSAVAANSSPGFLTILDSCNLVVLQLAFWMLGVGIILGAVWADESWGRPWAWDPKETFALVTWIAYLVIVHVRVTTVDKAWWTSVLSVFGFFLMLFNWIGVNYFLPGLHSYAG